MQPSVQRSSYNPDLNSAKLAQMIIFFLTEVDNIHLGKTKLMKLLYYADFNHFEKFGEPITGARYRKLPQGPVPDDATTMLDQLTSSGILHKEIIPRGQHFQEHYVPEEPVDVTVFGPTELEMLHEVAREWRNTPSQAVAEATHQEAPWNAVRLYELIPYHLAYFRNKYGALDLDPEELNWDDEEEIVAER